MLTIKSVLLCFICTSPCPIAGFIGAGLDFSSQQRLMWYILFVVYAPYAMLPLPLRWCVLAGYGTALTHMVMAGITLLRDPTYVRILGLHFGLSFCFFFFTKSIMLLVHPSRYNDLSSLATSQSMFCDSQLPFR